MSRSRCYFHVFTAQIWRLKAHDCAQAKESAQALQLSLYVRWTSPSGVSKVNRLLLRPVSSVEALQVQRPPATVQSPFNLTMQRLHGLLVAIASCHTLLATGPNNLILSWTCRQAMCLQCMRGCRMQGPCFACASSLRQLLMDRRRATLLWCKQCGLCIAVVNHLRQA